MVVASNAAVSPLARQTTKKCFIVMHHQTRCSHVCVLVSPCLCVSLFVFLHGERFLGGLNAEMKKLREALASVLHSGDHERAKERRRGCELVDQGHDQDSYECPFDPQHAVCVLLYCLFSNFAKAGLCSLKMMLE